MSDEQRVRTMAGWIGVEISRSRVRTAGKAGYGLYRVRGSIGFRNTCNPTPGNEFGYAVAEWTAYAFTLEEIETEIETAIRAGIPAGPSDLWLRPTGGGSPVGVTTRWTSAYRGSRTLGARAAGPALGEALERSTVRSRQRAGNAEFQADHLKRRAVGLTRRHEAKLARNAEAGNSPGSARAPAERSAERFSGGGE